MKKLLEEIDSLKEDIDTHRFVREHLPRQVRDYYKIAETYTNNALEGNALTESETKVVLEEGTTIGGKPLIHHLQALGLSCAYEYLYEVEHKKNFKEDTVKRFHWLFYNHIDAEKAGVYRKKEVLITGSKYPLPKSEEIQGRMKSWLSKQDHLRKELHPIVYAASVHKELVFINPFSEGNGVIARLMMNGVLLQEGYTLTLIPPDMRSRYIHSLEKSHEDDTDFVRFIAEMVRESQREYLRLFVC